MVTLRLTLAALVLALPLGAHAGDVLFAGTVRLTIACGTSGPVLQETCKDFALTFADGFATLAWCGQSTEGTIIAAGDPNTGKYRLHYLSVDAETGFYRDDGRDGEARAGRGQAPGLHRHDGRRMHRLG
jgi:hypothetical protein